ncbi:MAG: O-antigen ligase family protein [Eubacterium sp.]|nr:O-antigen ligase family protein [Eubacterium sp.]
MDTPLCGSTDKKLFWWLMFVLGASMLFPEYIAPLFVFILYIYFIFHFKKTGRNAKLGTMGKGIFAYLIFMLVSSIWSKTHMASILIALLWLGCFLTYIMVANVVNTKEKLKFAITAVNVSAGIIGLIATLEIITFHLSKQTGMHFVIPNPLFYGINDRVFDFLPVEIVNKPYRTRASATFDNPLILATYLVITTPFCAFGSVYFRHSRNRKISRACLVFAISGIVCTFSRGAYIAVGMSILIMLISNRRIFKKLFPFVFILAITIPIGLALRYSHSNGDFLASTSHRIDIWKYSFDMFLHHPIIGLGCGTDNIHTLLRDTYGIDRAHTHNLMLQMIVEGGIVGVAFAAAVVVIIAKRLYGLYEHKEYRYRPFAVLYTASITGFVVMSMFEFTLQSAKEMMTFFILLGLIEATARMETNSLQLADDELFSYEEITEYDLEEDAEEKLQKQNKKAVR